MNFPSALACIAALAVASPALAQPVEAPRPDAQSLWTYLQQQDYRKTFRFFPGKSEFYPGSEPHGALLTTYANSLAFRRLDRTEVFLPAGSIIVKENYDQDRRLVAITVMFKYPGYDPQHNDWFWMKRAADGRLEAAGRVESCIACHRTSNRDFIMTPVPR